MMVPPQLEKIPVQTIAAFFQHLQWKKLSNRNENFLFYQSPPDNEGETIEAALPSKDTFADSSRMKYQALCIVADILESSLDEIIARILSMQQEIEE